MTGMGIILSILIGALAGWIAEQIMKADHGLLTNILLGIGGAIVLNFLLGLIGVGLGGIIGQLIVAIAGACLLIWVYRMIRS
ncbi:GlsB/YeaQ/YmgE family stress response membrane protein [Pyruvatibacter mobilis]|uniref:GlsB/YeaQ/YmgE family stress response membrane protein n=1 Tax=Pyruvatibacter mobilis TaxID=1712261 RepID=A0A845QDI1_9HYPH|nr:GlsB/YeaQ/YmgE family stress response membrane protein [Pyruvatibacter mobilis]NBG96487.1 GlsB/YeaQ/YmgE family stress response membrane protein [Pyruvatibacter mobilis]QJD74620.1 GlsB/YeaQ/YmgE family stress response membrane protein [Pyruvatibacter mobilis]GGD08728.1 membrane protein [Pyruvatibacter mobilis]